MCGFRAKIILDGQTMTEFWPSTMGRLGEKVGGELCVKSRNKYLIKNKINLHLMKR